MDHLRIGSCDQAFEKLEYKNLTRQLPDKALLMVQEHATNGKNRIQSNKEQQKKENIKYV